jgi:plastocyanin
MRRKGYTAALLLLAGLMLGAVACSSTEPADPTPTTKFKITPASGTQPAATAAATKAATTPATTPAAAGTTAATGTAVAVSPTAGGTPSGAGTTLTITATNLLFDKNALTAAPGAVKITLDNKDGGIPHNFHLYLGKDTSGKDLGMTPITPGPAKDDLNVTLEAGTYYFQCDVHVTTMSGTLTVQ